MPIGKTARNTRLENSNSKSSIVPATHPATWCCLKPTNEKFLWAMFCLQAQLAELIYRVDQQNNSWIRLRTNSSRWVTMLKFTPGMDQLQQSGRKERPIHFSRVFTNWEREDSEEIRGDRIIRRLHRLGTLDQGGALYNRIRFTTQYVLQPDTLYFCL